jgi:pimeloyl-ACP methyl ester carboxylesterase
LRQEHVRQTLLDSVELARRQGSAGILFDLKSFAHAWPVDWKKIVVPTLIWHGGDDSILSEDMAHFLASRLPQAKLRIFPEEGHYSLPILRAEEILTALTEEVK